MRSLRRKTIGLGAVLVTVAIALTLVAPGAAAAVTPTASAPAADDASICLRVNPWDPSVYVDPDCGGPLPPVSVP